MKFFFLNHDQSYDFLKTRDSKRIANKLLAIFRKFFKTDEIRKAFNFSFTLDEKELNRRYDFLYSLLNYKIEDFDMPNLSIDENVKIGDVCFVTSDFEKYTNLKNQFRNLPIFFAETNSDLEVVKGYSQIRTDSSEISDVFPNAVLSDIPFPEIVFTNILNLKQSFKLTFDIFNSNKDVLSFLGFDLGFIDKLKKLSDVKEKSKDFYVESYLNEKVDDINKMIESFIASSKFDGKELLQSLSSHELPESVKNVVFPEIDKLQKEVSEKTHINIDLYSVINLTYPLSLNQDALQSLLESIWQEKLYYNFNSQVSFLRDVGIISINELNDFVDGIKDIFQALDFARGIINIIDHFDLHRPTFIDNGFEIDNAKSIFLQELQEDVESVNYFVDNSVLLTGANSGGKTSLLELISQEFILAYSGFFVPGNSKIGRINGLYFFSKPTKGTDAGAFETLLKNFSKINDENYLILADEIEAVTEPGAAAKILAGILHWFKNSLVIIVTHLGEELKNEDVNFDGIQALGISNGKLIVNRSPIKGIVAKSMPQLIIENMKDTPFIAFLKDYFKNS